MHSRLRPASGYCNRPTNWTIIQDCCLHVLCEQCHGECTLDVFQLRGHRRTWILILPSPLITSIAYQMTTMRGLIFVICAVFLASVRLSDAWMSTSCTRHRSLHHISTTSLLHAMPSSVLYFQSGNEENAVTDQLDTEIRLQMALQAARDADRRYGLCTPESLNAWKVVDDIYSSSSASRQVEDNVMKHLEKSIWSSF